jgi:segregation and condensation protein B
MNLEAQIEAVLFYKAEPMQKTALAELFSVSLPEVEVALGALAASLTNRGVQLVLTDTVVQLATASAASALIEQVRKDELRGDIGKAGAETLSIILYRGPISRIEIDRIRGVNSAFIIRNLLIRGLIERKPHPTDSRSFTYVITTQLLNQLGITNRESLPEFAEIMNALDAFEKQEEESAETTESNQPFTQ